MATILTCLLAFGATELDDRVVLKETATVESRYVRLMELIEEETLSDEARQAFEDVWLGASPKIGQSRVITAREIARELERRGMNSESFEFVGKSVTVKRVAKGLGGVSLTLREMMQVDLKNLFLKRNRGVRRSRIRVRVTYLSLAKFSADTKLLTVKPREVMRIGAVPFKAIFVKGDKDEQFEVDGIARFLRVVRVARASRNLRKYITLRASDIVMKEQAVETTDGYLTDFALVVGAKLLTAIKKGDALRPTQIQTRPVIRRGDTVLVKGEFVELYGIAAGDARLGHFVRVKFAKSGNIISCRVTGPGRAKLIEKD